MYIGGLRNMYETQMDGWMEARGGQIEGKKKCTEGGRESRMWEDGGRWGKNCFGIF